MANFSILSQLITMIIKLMCRLIKNNKLVKLTVCSSYLYPLVQVLCSVLYLTNHTIYLTPIVNCILSLHLLLSCLLHHVQASSRCARPKYALHAPSILIVNCTVSLYFHLFSCRLYHVQASSRCARPKYALHALGLGMIKLMSDLASRPGLEHDPILSCQHQQWYGMLNCGLYLTQDHITMLAKI